MSRKYDYNRDFFERINTPEKAYYLGWIMTDGHLRTLKPECRLHIHKKDIIVLENFVNLIGGDREQIKISERDIALLSFSSFKMVQDLNKIGVPSGKKAYKLNFPKIKKSFLSHLVRGCIEGDGSFFIKKHNGVPHLRLSFVGTKSMCEGIIQSLNYDKKYVYSKGKSYEVQKGISYSSDILKLYNYLYQDCGEYYLPRKREKLAEIYKERVQWENLQMMKKSKVEVICV
jgi:hypothetical protein